ncbi:signal transduction histidine kinase [Planoprotostelium fungivorum]|uniref:Signal transduction histidine kinase n=1 Tax=Planoprotostelium fungivorum TaxID=1890364 RepID=A0A2P6MZF3_9EUKA|nr:signal transduction histidine kinase [Planoprotostelium fungivorum]
MQEAALIPYCSEKVLPIVCFSEFPIQTQIQTDRGRLRQIICNLLSNAIKFTDAGQVVMNGKMTDGETLEISASDSGVGLSEEFKQRIFSLFQQSDSSITRKYGGTGLGLSICKRTCIAMGGDISVESIEGRGATFRLHVRASPCETSEEGNVLRIMVEQLLKMSRKRIAVIEGQRNQSDMLRTTLESLGMIVETFDDDRQIMPTAQGCDLVIVDRSCLRDAIIIFSGNFAPGVERKEEQLLWKPFKRRQIVKLLHRNLVPQNHSSTLRVEKKEEDLNGLKILVAEDNVTNQKVIHRILTKMGVRDIRFVDDGEKAAQSCKEDKYHLVLMDCNMPGGIDATCDIVKLLETDRPCVVGLTADVSAGNRRDCLDAGMSDILTKPVDRDHLRRIVMDAYHSLSIPGHI